MTITEIRRRTMAEDLMVMMGVFPLELCVVALERSRDDTQYAANWLLERGYQELDRWAKDTIAMSKREEEEREKRMMRQLVVDESAKKGSGGGGGGSASSTTTASGSGEGNEEEGHEDGE